MLQDTWCVVNIVMVSVGNTAHVKLVQDEWYIDSIALVYVLNCMYLIEDSPASVCHLRSLQL